jgi:hypothetical protein
LIGRFGKSLESAFGEISQTVMVDGQLGYSEKIDMPGRLEKKGTFGITSERRN